MLSLSNSLKFLHQNFQSKFLPFFGYQISRDFVINFSALFSKYITTWYRQFIIKNTQNCSPIKLLAELKNSSHFKIIICKVKLAEMRYPFRAQFTSSFALRRLQPKPRLAFNSRVKFLNVFFFNCTTCNFSFLHPFFLNQPFRPHPM